MRLFHSSSLLNVGLLLCLSVNAFGQQARGPRETAIEFLRNDPARFNLTAADVAELRVSDEYRTKHNGVTHVWLQQMYKGIPVQNGLIGLHVLPDNKVMHNTHRFVPELAARVNTTMPSLSAAKAVDMARLHLGFQGFATPSVREQLDARHFVFDGGAISRQPIPVSAVYQPMQDGRVRLGWHLEIDQANTSDIWSLVVDAQTGEIINKHNYTVYCQSGDIPHTHSAGGACADQTGSQQKSAAVAGASGTYRVFPLPAESPEHGTHELVATPHDPAASPFGWHDTDGQAGPEYTIPRGNNVFAYEDINDDNAPPAAPGPDGGPGLIFDFPYDPNAEPLPNLNAAIVNLFYMNNMMHDIAYRFGFDEAAGNFQQNNYGRGGAGGDYVRAEAQDGGGTNNANFATPADGGGGRMQMFVWDGQAGNLVRANAPVAVLGTYAAQAAAGWGKAITTTPVTADVEIVDDASADPTQGCFPIVNDVAGKIVLIDRGGCEFGEKALGAQNAGAVGCIICNFEDGAMGMSPGSVGNQANQIPVVSMGKLECDRLRQFVGQGLNVSIVLPTVAGPARLDGDFDNGIIAHEFGHGISNRLTGGPSQAGCLGNEEQMGEGWSDFMALITTAKPGDVAEKRRGIGTFVLRESNEGVGIRRFPYSADMNTFPLTFGDVATSGIPHPLGEIWAGTLWDLYWALSEKYGFDPDLTNTSSGNARAIQLVMDGMKLQPCFPGFIDGRNAILQADIINNDGQDTCLISEVFARRGMGINASQGSSNESSDGVEDFNPIPTCIRELKIAKTGTNLVVPGDPVTYTITVTNHKGDTAPNVVVTDELPAGATLVSASNGGVLNGNLIVWNLGDMPNLQVVELTYTAKTDPSTGSIGVYRDDLETDIDWGSFGTSLFFLQDNDVKVGAFAWRANSETDEDNDFHLTNFTPIPVSGNQPVMRFWHQYNTAFSFDAGFIEVQVAGDNKWIRFDDEKLFRGTYSGGVSYNTVPIPFLRGFSGNSNGWVQSYVDMSEFAGREINLRFRFVSDITNNVADGGWIVDGLEFIDMYNVNPEACVSSSAGDQACVALPERGTIFEPVVVSTDEPDQALASILRVQPNPSSDVFYLSSSETIDEEVALRLFGADGRLVWQQNLNRLVKGQIVPIDAASITPGMYLLRLDSSAGSFVEKLVKR